MNCCYCGTELTNDFLGSCCLNEECNSVDGIIKVDINPRIKHWYKNGKCHREDGPAAEWCDGTKYWYKNGLLHREDGPAVETSNGEKCWYKNGLKHRENGPAVERPDGTTEYWVNGKKIK
jgi:hypothetical protein